MEKHSRNLKTAPPPEQLSPDQVTAKVSDFCRINQGGFYLGRTKTIGAKTKEDRNNH